MYKVDMLKVLTAVVLLTVASVLDAAPMMPGEEPTDGGKTGQNQLTCFFPQCIQCIHLISSCILSQVKFKSSFSENHKGNVYNILVHSAEYELLTSALCSVFELQERSFITVWSQHSQMQKS